MKIRSIAVFCGSNSGRDSLFISQTARLGHLLAEKNITLVYGGGKKGLMGAIADAVLDAGGKARGIIPRALTEWEQEHKGLTELVVVPDMHTRKKMMYEWSDAAVILPGGFGTMDELFEMLTWNQLKIHDKKIFILNTSGFYDALIAYLRTAEREGFLYDPLDERVVVCGDADELAAQL